MADIDNKSLTQLTDYELEVIKSFNKRIQSIYDHERYVFKIVRYTKRLVSLVEKAKQKTDEIQELEKFIKDTIKALKSEVLKNFEVLGNVSDEENEIAIERERRARILNINTLIKDLYQKTSLEGQKLEKVKGSSRAFKKIQRNLKRLNEVFKKEEKSLSANEHVTILLRNMHEFAQQIKNSIAYEYSLLEKIKLNNCFSSKSAKENKIQELNTIMNKLRVFIKQFRDRLRKEKDELYDPLMELILVENRGIQAAEELKASKKKITIKDMRKDLKTMTRTEEISQYLSALSVNKRLLDAKAKKYLENSKIILARATEREKTSSLKDPLTGLYTRRMFKEKMDDLIELAHGRPDAFAFILIDIDHFKLVNDTYGHPTGDKVLIDISKIIRQSIRGSDIPYRYGGEELGIILPRTDVINATAIAENIRQKVEFTTFITVKGEEIRITISAGVSSYAPGFTKEDVITLADQRLYAAKKTRNRVIGS